VLAFGGVGAPVGMWFAVMVIFRSSAVKLACLCGVVVLLPIVALCCYSADRALSTTIKRPRGSDPDNLGRLTNLSNAPHWLRV
jgi:hypothetical protein